MNIFNLFVFSLLWLLMPLAAQAEKKLKVITTTTDLADIVRQIGGDKVDVLSLSHGVQNPHFVEPKPSLVVKLMGADAFVQTGLELEVGWIPLLLQSSRNNKIFPGSAGHIDASEAIQPIEIPMNPSRAMGDVHPHGNPHYMADPKNGVLVARFIADKLSRLSPENKAAFEFGYENLKSDIQAKLEIWTKQMEPYRGTKYVSYHKDWVYFAERFGLVSTGEIEPKPGIPPTGPHTSELIDRMKAERVKIIITDPWYEARTGEFISRETGAGVLQLYLFPEGRPGSKSYQDTIGFNVESVVKALQKKEASPIK